MKILVTGCNGYIGSVLTELLLNAGCLVNGIDTNFYSDLKFFDSKSITVKNMDIRDIEIEDIIGYECVVHLANISNDPMGELDPDVTFDINYKATVRLAEISKKAGIKKFIYFSTQSVYGNSSGEWVNELTEVKPITAYAKSKHMSEIEISKMAGNGFIPVFLRPTTVCGLSPRIRCDLLINAMTANAVTSHKIFVFGNQEIWRSSLHVNDLCNAVLKIILDNKFVENKIYNIGGAKNNNTILEIAKKVNEIYPKCEIIYTNELGKDARNYKSDCSLFSKDFPEFTYKMTTDMCIKELVEKFTKLNLTADQVKNKFTRLNTLNSLIMSKKLDSKLRWVK